jgi:Flp pilus assembly protein TadG
MMAAKNGAMSHGATKMRRIIRRVRGIRSERGAALVEFALVVPLLMMMMCATIDFGLAVYTLNNLTAAVREGGRLAAVQDPTSWTNGTAVTAAKTRVYNYISGMNNGLTPAQVQALISVSNPDATTKIITVQITGYPYKPVTPLSTLLGLQTIYLNRTAIFRWEMGS